MTHSCCFCKRGNQDFPEFIEKKFYNIDYWTTLQLERIVTKGTHFIGQISRIFETATANKILLQTV